MADDKSRGIISVWQLYAGRSMQWLFWSVLLEQEACWTHLVAEARLPTVPGVGLTDSLH